MTNTELLAAVRIWRENGALSELAKGDDVSAVLAQFAEATLEQMPVSWQSRFCDPPAIWGECSKEHHALVKSVLHEWPGYETRELFALPPVPAPTEIEQRAERAAKAVVKWLYEGLDGPTTNLMAINVEAIIKSVMRGEE